MNQPDQSSIGDFLVRYQDLQTRMRALAEADGDVFVPNPEPSGPADYVFVAMEPSLGGGTADSVRVEVESGARNFVNSLEDFLLHFSIRRYLCGAGQRYHITDVSKGAMPTDHASGDRESRWDRWYDLLMEELGLVAKPEAPIFAVGRSVESYLKGRGWAVNYLLHYSPTTRSSRSKCIAGHEDSFEGFKGSVSLQDVLGTAEEVLRGSVPERLGDKTMAYLTGRQLSDSDKKLIFCYKLVFAQHRR